MPNPRKWSDSSLLILIPNDLLFLKDNFGSIKQNLIKIRLFWVFFFFYLLFLFGLSLRDFIA